MTADRAQQPGPVGQLPEAGPAPSVPIPVYQDLEVAARALADRRVTHSLEVPPQVAATIRAVFGQDLSPQQVVERVIADVRSQGDAAVRRYTLAFDGAQVGELRVPQQELDEAVRSVPADLRAALELAAERVRRFHERSRRQSWLDFGPGSALGQLVVPLQRVGIYAPGGRAAYPSTVLMAAAPARVAGVQELVLATPAGRDGQLNAAVLAAARIAGVDEVYRIGGAQAIAALAYGTESVRPVDKIVGPGSVFVVLAKQAVSSDVGIDGAPGPTETVVVADSSAHPAWIAADMIAQAEHDPMAQSVLVCTDRTLADAVVGELDRQLSAAERRQVVAESFSRRGAIVVAESVDAAIEFANRHSPEHLCLSVADPWSHLAKVRCAGGVFIGEWSVEALGDYTAGPSHIMPTGGTARYASSLNLDDFIKVVPVFSYDPRVLQAEAHAAIALAQAEGLYGHAAAIQARLSAPPPPAASGQGGP